ncbi:MAG: hypothetical protein NZO58_08465, partial [Gemmataceae bacterium]|nr:hypothetical protein [Gemmataceae bacterium]
MPRSRTDPGSSLPPRYPGTFLLALREALAAFHWRAIRWLGSAVQCVDAAGREHILGLENLYRRLRREERSDWPMLISAMLHSIPAEPTETLRLVDVADRVLV